MILNLLQRRIFVLTIAVLVPVSSAQQSLAMPVADYRKTVEQVIAALDTLGAKDENETATEQEARNAITLKSVQTLIPQKLNVEWNGRSFTADNDWLHQELHEFEKAPQSERPQLLSRIQEQLRALQQRLLELDKVQLGDQNKADEKARLEEILARSDYKTKDQSPSLVAQLWQRFLRWLTRLFGRQEAIEPSSARRITEISQYFVIGLAILVIAYALRVFVPTLRRDRRVKKTAKAEPRIVLGERLEPEQSASSILSEAEALARQGDIRAAIRKAYIALLVELGERKIISLAQHKTNRDYVSSVRDRRLLHGRMINLTDSFERHWYGFAVARETDWAEFRARYVEALKE
jgi:Domain of unknown function (DUF4129)